MHRPNLGKTLIQKYNGVTPAQFRNALISDLENSFPSSILARTAPMVLIRCNSWVALDRKIKELHRFANSEKEKGYIDELYFAYDDIRSDSNKSFALSKRIRHDAGHFTICPHCWRFVYKWNNKIKKNPYCCFHKPGSAAYQRGRRALNRTQKNEAPIWFLPQKGYLQQTKDILRPTGEHVLKPPARHFRNYEHYLCTGYTLVDIWPFLPLTKNYVLKNGGNIEDTASIVRTLDPIERIDPLDMWDENDTAGAKLVKEHRMMLHEIFVRDPSLFKPTLCLAEAWLQLERELRSAKGGPRANSGGRREGAGRPRKDTAQQAATSCNHDNE